MASRISVGTAYVQLLPSMTSFNKLIKKELGATGREFTKSMSVPAAESIAKATRNIGKNIGRQGTVSGKEFGLNLARSVETTIGGAASTIFKGLATPALGAAKLVANTISNTIKTGVNGAAIGATIGAGLAVGAATALGKQTLGLGINRVLEIENAEAKLKALKYTVSQVNSIRDTVLESVLDTQFNLDEGMTVAVSALATGIKEKGAGGLLDYMRMIQDTAIITGGSLGEIGHVFNKVQSTGRAYTMELNQLADRGLPVFSWLAEDLKISVEELYKTIRDGDITANQLFSTITARVGGASLTAASTTTANISKMRAAQARIGQNLVNDGLPYFNEIVLKATEFGKRMEKVAAEHGPAFWAKMGPIMVEAFDFDRMLNKAQKFYGFINDRMKQFNAWKNESVTGRWLTDLASIFSKNNLSAAGQNIFAEILNVARHPLTQEMFKQLRLIFTSQNIIGAISTMWEGLKNVAREPVVQDFLSGIENWLAGGGLQKAWAKLGEYMKAFYVELKGYVKAIIDFFQTPAMQDFMSKAQQFLSDPTNVINLTKIAAGMWGIAKVLPVLDSLITGLNIAGGLFSPIAGGLGAAVAGGKKGRNMGPSSIFVAGGKKVPTPDVQGPRIAGSTAAILPAGAGAAKGLDKVTAGLGRILASLGDIGGWALRAIPFVGWIITAAGLLADIIPRIFDSPEKAAAGFDQLVKFGQSAWELMIQIGAALGAVVTPIVDLLFETITGVFSIMTGQEDKAQAALEVFKFIANSILVIFTGIKWVMNVVAVVVNVITAAISALLWLIVGVVNTVMSVTNFIGGAMAGLMGKDFTPMSMEYPQMPDLAGNIGSLDWSMPAFLATGGDVLPRQGGTLAVLAEAGEAETVVNRGQMNRTLAEMERSLRNQADSDGGETVFNITVNPSQGMNETQLADKVLRSLPKRKKRYAT